MESTIWSAFSLIDWAERRLPRMPVTTTSSISVASGSCEAGAVWAKAAAGTRAAPRARHETPIRRQLARRTGPRRFQFVAIMPSSPATDLFIGLR